MTRPIFTKVPFFGHGFELCESDGFDGRLSSDITAQIGGNSMSQRARSLFMIRAYDLVVSVLGRRTGRQARATRV
ncbi:hypothetical protein MCEMSEM23_02463 [Rhabdaerophilaceae bacterium]